MENEDNKKHMLLSNDIFRWTYKDYIDWCDECDIPEDERFGEDEDGGHLFNEWRHEQVEQDIDCDLDNMAYSNIKDRMFVITGAIQLWNGRPTIKPIFMRGLVNVIKKIWGSGDRHFLIELDTNEGIITSRLWSHDDPLGSTHLEVRMLNKNGEKWLAAAEERGDEDEIEINNRWWSKITDIGMIY